MRKIDDRAQITRFCQIIGIHGQFGSITDQNAGHIHRTGVGGNDLLIIVNVVQGIAPAMRI